MESNLTYTEALLKLEEIVEQIEDDSIMLDTLTEKVMQANELIKYCETKLRTIEGDVRDVLQ
ncbi:exodeoxyribonuclease VII small subunit [Cytophaga hutchinsonii]|uniref:Exodeoxyribonuclease VII small subunit n=1 Tax=Cytophaga hutchinsonii (strain ATCC 33406 / DSM 1761 / CIP 103989 / NBRC 15051 / NCIMB 9469 / D465) TaxID=269798 RepID=A0A6N4SW87_CYTH3|nr:exodeoxyribonuclease VII small subunit [Cytophaga hutchinsonii]ABG60555.1 Exodeoxyribonuclease VII small subunit [Cytophaga hutchinsonii ATCC 33406]SFX90187.1 Exodeoxyribonuclease VII small subunit [Cytophaga hutchinsonii ATCC 33406]